MQKNDCGKPPTTKQSFPRKDYGDNPEYMLDSIQNPSIVAEKVATALENGHYDYYFQSIDAKQRAQKLIEISDRFSNSDFWHYARKFWADGYDDEKALILLLTDRPQRELLMRKHEHSVFDKLPDEIIVYRGCKKSEPFPWWSWTIDEAIARKFAVSYKSEGDGIILRGRCRKADVVAYFDFEALREREVIVNPKLVHSIEQRRTTFAFIEEREGKAPWERWMPDMPALP